MDERGLRAVIEDWKRDGAPRDAGPSGCWRADLESAYLAWSDSGGSAARVQEGEPCSPEGENAPASRADGTGSDAAEIERLREENESLRRAVARARPLVALLTVRQVIEAGGEALEASGLNPWCVNEGLAQGGERLDPWWLDAGIGGGGA